MRAPLVIAKLVGKGNHYQVSPFYFEGWRDSAQRYDGATFEQYAQR